jgi:hypothetical protein
MLKFLKRLWAAQARAAQGARRVVTVSVALALLVALAVGGAYAMAGLALALLVIAGVLVTVGVIPGFWWFATSRGGYPVVVILTGLAAHALFGATTLTGIFAIAWTLVLKTGVLSAARRRVRDGRDPSPLAVVREARAAADVAAREALGLVQAATATS